MDKATLRIRRFDPYRDLSPYFTEYNLEYAANDQLLDLFERIKSEIDPTFTYRRSCRHGICGSCAVKVAGKPILACRTPVRTLTAEFGWVWTITPLDESKVIHDLVSDMTGFWEKHDSITPYLLPSKGLALRSPAAEPLETRFFNASSALAGDADYCIQCGACYYVCPGCNPKMAEPELLKSVRAVAAHMGIHLIELDKVSCCGGAHLQDKNPFQSLLLNARNFTFAERLQLDMVTICNTCQFVLSEAHRTLTRDEDARRQINLRLNTQKRRFQGTSRPRNFLYVLMEDIGRSEIRRHVRRPLTGLKVAPFYGCHLYSPADIQKEYTGRESPWNPHSLETLIADLGGKPVPFPQKTSAAAFIHPFTSRKRPLYW